MWLVRSSLYPAPKPYRFDDQQHWLRGIFQRGEHPVEAYYSTRSSPLAAGGARDARIRHHFRFLRPPLSPPSFIYVRSAFEPRNQLE